MKTVSKILFLFAFFALILSACGGATPTPLVIVVTATPLPPTESALEPTATLAPIALGGAQRAQSMKWIDGGSLIYIPFSDFSMGNGDFNAPIHNVTLDDYWMYAAKVTNRMYAQCVAVGACGAPAQELGGPVYSNPEFSNHPVVGVTWEQAQTYCAWAGGSLPTEAQWEKAARGEAANPYPWGSADPACDIVNFSYCNGSTSEVTAFKNGVSAYGLYDMAGNVFEWTADWYGESYYNESALVNPTGPQSGDYRVIRGSSFESYPDQMNLAIRHFNSPSNHRRDIGFRCVVAEPKPYAPFCQLAAFIPAGVVSSGACELPQAQVAGQYCLTGDGYATVDIPAGAVYEVSKNLTCTEAVIDGQRRLTCIGPRAKESTNEVTVCNPTCSSSPDQTGAQPTCQPGYTLDAASAACNYTPILGQAGVAGCPTGYQLLNRGGESSCVIGLDANGQCPAATYFDSLAGVCVSPNGLAETPYGLDNPALASTLYAGCPAGYAYSDTFQCCQALTGGTYPGCEPGTKFDSTLGACSAGKVRLSGPGCVTLDVTTIQCSEPVNVCKRVNDEFSCLKIPQCKWTEKTSSCELRAP